MIDWALRTSLPDGPALSEAASDLRQCAPAQNRVMAIVLAGNVFTAAIRAVVFPILAGIPTILKASSRDSSLPAALSDAWASVWPEARDALQCQSPPRGHPELLSLLLSEADIVSVYGSDETIRTMRALVRETTPFISHGHGLGLLYVPASALQNQASAQATAEAIALDVIAYDQRGCLSPHSVLIEAANSTPAKAFALETLPEAMDKLSLRFPKGTMPESVLASQLQWRGVAAALGELQEHNAFAISFEDDGVLRPSPGWRNIQTLTVRGRPQAIEKILPYGHHLKALGVAGDERARAEMTAALPSPLNPRVCRAGEMQTPPLASLQDGLSPWHALT